MFEPGNPRVGCAHQHGELPLSQARLRAQCMDFLGDLGVERGFCESPESCRPAVEVPTIQNRKTVRDGTLALVHGVSLYEWRCGLALKTCIRRRARSISTGATAAACFTTPCEITTAARPCKK